MTPKEKLDRLQELLSEAETLAQSQTTLAGTHLAIYGHILSALAIVERLQAGRE